MVGPNRANLQRVIQFANHSLVFNTAGDMQLSVNLLRGVQGVVSPATAGWSPGAAVGPTRLSVCPCIRGRPVPDESSRLGDGTARTVSVAGGLTPVDVQDDSGDEWGAFEVENPTDDVADRPDSSQRVELRQAGV